MFQFVLVSLLIAVAGLRSDGGPGWDAESRSGLGTVEARTVVLEGHVREQGELPAAGALVMTSDGVSTVADAQGRYELSLLVPPGVEAIHVTAVGGGGQNQTAGARVALAAGSGRVSVGTLYLTTSPSCVPSWLPTFGEAAAVNSYVLALAVFDDGNGPELYVGGQSISAGSVKARGIVKWTKDGWRQVGDPLSQLSTVNAMVVYDDGSGPALYVGGSFALAGNQTVNRIARWDGSNWGPLGVGVNAPIEALIVHDDGTGAALYVGGRFTSAGGMPAGRIAKWDGTNWAPLGTGLDKRVQALAIYDDGTGAALYAGGTFLNAGGVPAQLVAKWDGANWAAVGGGVQGNGVHALLVHDDGGGPELYVGGSFLIAGGMSARNVARWNGASWRGVGTGSAARINTFVVHDDGSGPALYAGAGDYFSPAGAYKWDGSSWLQLGTLATSSTVEAMLSCDVGNGASLLIGGNFGVAGGSPVVGLAKWSGVEWTWFEAYGVTDQVLALAEHDDGTGRALYVAGRFTSAASQASPLVARWDGVKWSATGFPTVSRGERVHALAVYDDGSGPALYAGGVFQSGPFAAAPNVARWTGTGWVPVGGGVGGPVLALRVHDDGSGAALYVGGEFVTAGGVQALRIAKWDGSNWSAFGGGLDGTAAMALEVFDDGGGPALIVAGKFSKAGGVPARNFAKWNGTTWSGLGSGTNGAVHSLAIHDDGAGPALFAGGEFLNIGGGPVGRIAKWSGSSWSSMSGGMDNTVRAIVSHDDGTGPALYAGGSFFYAGGVTSQFIARWDGSSWSRPGTGMESTVFALASCLDGGGPALIAGGSFRRSFDSGDSFIAKWGCPEPSYPGFCFGDGGDQLGCTSCPCGNDAAVGSNGGCLHAASGARGAELSAVGLSNLTTAFDRVRFAVRGASAATIGFLLSGDERLPNHPANPCFAQNPGSGERNPAFLDGLRCVDGAVLRHGARSTDGSGNIGVTNDGWGPPDEPLGGLGVTSGFAAGQTRHFQCIYRVPVATVCGTGLNTTNGVSVTFR